MGKGGEQRTKAAFQALHEQREAIERAYGTSLAWQLLPEKRGCRIYAVVDGGWKTAEDEWPELQDRLIDAMVRLERSFKSPLTSLSV